VLTFWMDDSADKKREWLFVVAGFLGSSEVVFEAERHWQAKVNSVGLDYFRTNECHTLSGEFQKLVIQHGWEKARRIADDLLADLWPIVRSANLLGFCFLGPMPDYNAVQVEPYSEYTFERDPYIVAHHHLIYHVAAWVCQYAKPPEPVAFTFDEHSKATPLIERWKQQKDNFPIAAPCMGSLASLDDKISPAIQMGDLLANTTKRAFEDKITTDPQAALEYLKKVCGHNLTWVAAWNDKYLRDLREASLDAATAPPSIAFEYKAEPS